MKKVVVSIFLVGVIILSSCTKDYKCTYEDNSGTEAVFEYEGLSKSEAKTAEDGCITMLEGTWSTN